jgi:aminotransferase EvaB
MKTPLLINNLRPKLKNHKSLLQSAIENVIDSGWLVLGSQLKRFESAFATYLETTFCLGVANGTDAIELSLRAMGVNFGDKVATVANAGMYTTTAVMACGAEPYFMDVDGNTYNVTFKEVVGAVENGVKVVVITHLYGNAISEIEAIAEYCDSKGVYLLEDCAQAHGAKVNGKHVGTFGDAASFSFYPTKNLGALGDGGAICTDNAVIAERITLLRQYGWKEKYVVSIVGARNSRLDEIQAAVLCELLPFLDQMNERRRQIANKYTEFIKHPAVITPNHSGENYVAHLYVVRVINRNSLRHHLEKYRITSDIHYPIPDYKQPIFDQRFNNMRLISTENLASEVLTLPCYPEMTESEVEQVIDAINLWLP